MSYKYDHNRDFVSKIAPHEYSASEIEAAKQANNDMPQQTNRPPLPQAKRPVSITILCILCFISSIFGLVVYPIVYSNLGLPTWFTVMAILDIVTGLISIIGLWKMRRWGVTWWFISFLIGIVTFWGIGANLVILSNLISLVLLIFVFSKRNLMN